MSAQPAQAMTVQAYYQGRELDGATDVPVRPGEIAFYFDHNVVSQLEQNKGLFYLTSEDGTDVQLEVSTHYDESQPDDPNMERRWIYVTPAQLEPETSYRLGIREGIEAPAGTYGAYEVSFTTGTGGGEGQGGGSGDGDGSGEGEGPNSEGKGDGEEPGGSGSASPDDDPAEEPQGSQKPAAQPPAEPSASPEPAGPSSLQAAYRLVGGGGGGSSGEGEGPAPQEESAAALPLAALAALLLIAIGAVRRGALWRQLGGTFGERDERRRR